MALRYGRNLCPPRSCSFNSNLQVLPTAPILAILLSIPVGCFGASIPDGVVGLQADPLGDGPVLLLGLGQLLLGAERLVGLSQELAWRVHGMLESFSRGFGYVQAS